MERPMVQDRLLAIVGPTGVGKSDLAVRLAMGFGGEIVNADSRQVYRHMDIGTAKPSPEVRAVVNHHLIDVVDPDEDYNLGLFLKQAPSAIEDIQGRSRLPIMVGGTGQWVWALLEGWQVPQVPPDPPLRRSLEERASREGFMALHGELSRLNPREAGRIDPRNVRRVIRALEVAHSPSSQTNGFEQPRKHPPSYRVSVLGLTLDRPELYRRIDDRVDRMVKSGWIEEVRGLLDSGYSPPLPSLSGLGYGELVRYLANDMTLEAALERIKHRTHRFARHQYAWFRPSDRRIQWFDADTGLDEAEDSVARWLELSHPVRPCI